MSAVPTRRHLASLAALVVVGSGTFVAASAVAPAPLVRQPAPVSRVHAYFPEGPTAAYHSDTGSIGPVSPLRFAVTGGGRQVGVVEASFSYRTKGAGPFTVEVSVSGDPGGKVRVRPAQRVLAPAPGGASTTVRFLAPGLRSGHRYLAVFEVDSVVPDTGVNRISTHKVLLTVETS